MIWNVKNCLTWTAWPWWRIQWSGQKFSHLLHIVYHQMTSKNGLFNQQQILIQNPITLWTVSLPSNLTYAFLWFLWLRFPLKEPWFNTSDNLFEKTFLPNKSNKYCRLFIGQHFLKHFCASLHVHLTMIMFNVLTVFNTQFSVTANCYIHPVLTFMFLTS
jgi:hypothetical protein